MITMERLVEDMWSDGPNTHVIVHEAWEHSLHQPGFYVRDEDGDVGVARDLAGALLLARAAWGVVELGPALRLKRDVEDGDPSDGMQWLTEYLAEYGTVGINAQALAQRVFARIEEEG